MEWREEIEACKVSCDDNEEYFSAIIYEDTCEETVEVAGGEPAEGKINKKISSTKTTYKYIINVKMNLKVKK